MINSRKRTVAAGVAALAVVGGAGAAIAASHLTPQQESAAVVDNAAKRLGVSSAKLTDALRQAEKDRVDAQVQAGMLTKAEGDALKARIDSGQVPLVGFGFDRHDHFGHDGPGGLDAAASYLGMTETELHTALEGGKTLAVVAKDKGKSVDGLVEAMVKAAKADLDQAVTAGRLTDAQRQSIETSLKQRITDAVNHAGPGPEQRPDGDHFGFRGPPLGAPPA
jgi:hypothetical protein